MLASSSEKSSEASAGSIAVVALSSSGAISASFISVSIKGVGARGTLLQIAGGATVSLVADAADVLHGIPRLSVRAIGSMREVLLGPASSTVIAVVRAEGSLASNSFVSDKALALSSSTVADSLVGALSPGMKIVGVDNLTDPGEILGASAE